MLVRELVDKAEMLKYLPVLNELYPSLTEEEYSRELDEMLPCRYGQVAAFEEEECVAICGFWIGNKLWVGKYLELDNIVVRSSHRSQGIGKLLFDFLERKAIEHECHMLSLDSYTSNFKAHKFFYNEGYAPKGFHFVKLLNKDAVR
ncbi:MAG: GNAT family N-acetyltransferase [Flavobacteriales bacterium]